MGFRCVRDFPDVEPDPILNIPCVAPWGELNCGIPVTPNGAGPLFPKDGAPLPPKVGGAVLPPVKLKVGLGTSFGAPAPNENILGGLGGIEDPKLNTGLCVFDKFAVPKLEACDWVEPKLLFVPNVFEVGVPKAFWVIWGLANADTPVFVPNPEALLGVPNAEVEVGAPKGDEELFPNAGVDEEFPKTEFLSKVLNPVLAVPKLGVVVTPKPPDWVLVVATPKAEVLEPPKALPLPKPVLPPNEFEVPKAGVVVLPNPVLTVVVVPNELLLAKDEFADVFALKLKLGVLLLPNEGDAVVLVEVPKGEVAAVPNMGFDVDVPNPDDWVFTGPPKIVVLFCVPKLPFLFPKTEELFTPPNTDEEVVVVVAPNALVDTKETVVVGVPKDCIVFCTNWVVLLLPNDDEFVVGVPKAGVTLLLPPKGEIVLLGPNTEVVFDPNPALEVAWGPNPPLNVEDVVPTPKPDVGSDAEVFRKLLVVPKLLDVDDETPKVTGEDVVFVGTPKPDEAVVVFEVPNEKNCAFEVPKAGTELVTILDICEEGDVFVPKADAETVVLVTPNVVTLCVRGNPAEVATLLSLLTDPNLKVVVGKAGGPSEVEVVVVLKVRPVGKLVLVVVVGIALLIPKLNVPGAVFGVLDDAMLFFKLELALLGFDRLLPKE